MAMETVLRDTPIQLMDPTFDRPPTPEPGCAVCDSLQIQINAASDPHSERYNPSEAIDLRILMNRHQVDEVAP
ncbi:hypothetical protein ACGFZQ_33755 [Streptomyces sp. NPDC048254]|uniref:hypothetical protein n=1 Tax=Streptomyces sp. NPDC048254 TaxID=3365525 RepID=UPI00371D7AE7